MEDMREPISFTRPYTGDPIEWMKHYEDMDLTYWWADFGYPSDFIRIIISRWGTDEPDFVGQATIMVVDSVTVQREILCIVLISRDSFSAIDEFLLHLSNWFTMGGILPDPLKKKII